MGEDGRFRISVAGNLAMIATVLCSAFWIIVTVTQKYDSLTSAIDGLVLHVNSADKQIDTNARTLDELGKRVEAQGQHIITDEQRETALEGRVEVLTQFLSKEQPEKRK